MSGETLSVLQVAEAVKEGAKKARQQRDIFDSIAPDINSVNRGERITDFFTNEEALRPDEPDEIYKRPPIVIRDNPTYRQYLKIPKKHQTNKEIEEEKRLIEYLEKYIGRIFFYYKTEFHRQNKITSDIVVQCNFVPKSPMRRYVIPSGVPVAVPRWIVLFLRQQCVNNIVSFEKKPQEVLQAELSSGYRQPGDIVEDSVLTIRKGESLIQIMELPSVPTSFVE